MNLCILTPPFSSAFFFSCPVRRNAERKNKQTDRKEKASKAEEEA